MLTLIELHALLQKNRCDYELIHHETELLSPESAIQYFDLSKAAPVFLLESKNGYAALVLSGARNGQDFAQLRESTPALERYHIAAKSNIERITGYPPGAVPLIGHGLPCFFDHTLLAFDYIYGSTGDPRCTLKIRPDDVLYINKVIAQV